EAKLSESEEALFEKLCKLFFEATGIGWREPQQRLLDALLQAFASGERTDDGKLNILIPEPEAAAARDGVEAMFRRKLRAEQAVTDVTHDDDEAQVEPEPPHDDDERQVEPEPLEIVTPTPGDERPADPGAGVTWESLPADWKARYGGERSLGV